MKFGKFVALQLKSAFCSATALGLLLGILIMVIGQVKGSITLEIELSRSDSVWFLLGVPLTVTLLFLLVTPVSFLVHAAISRVLNRKSGHDL